MTSTADADPAARHAGTSAARSSEKPATIAARAVQVARLGGPDVLVVHDIELPAPQSRRCAGAGGGGRAFGDVLLRVGMRRVPRPAVPGHEAVGTVAAVGPGVDGLAVGDPVAVYTQGQGGYATHVLAPAWAVLPRPAHLDPHAVVALVLNYVTAWQMLTRTAVVPERSTVLVHGAGGGVGSAPVQLAAVRGLRVIGTASTGKVLHGQVTTDLWRRRRRWEDVHRAGAVALGRFGQGGVE